MEEKVVETLRILDDDGDSFAKRAEMYYRRRPELVNFVEESFRSYKALADRYDHLSKELQSANRTIASVYPGQVETIIDDHSEEEEEQEENDSSSPHPMNETRKGFVPKAPNTPKKDFRSPSMMLLTRKAPPKRINTSAKIVALTPCSGLTKDEAFHEIDKLQKDILALQTEKEFVRSIYERAYEKYWEIEDKITEMQKRVSILQDEFGAGNVIEDNDARALMAATALRSCQDTLIKLQEIQAQSSKEAKVEYERVKEAHEMFETLRDEFISKFMSQQEQENGEKSKSIVRSSEGKGVDDESIEHEVPNVGLLREKIMEKLEVDSGHSFTVTEVAERIDELVNKVVTLETAVSSQTGLVKRLRSETDELQTNIKKLEDDKEMLVEGSEVTNKKLQELEEELRRVKLLNRSVRSQDNTLQTHFTEATCDLEHLSGKLNDMKPDVEEETRVLYNTKKSALDGKPGKESDNNLAEMKDVKTLVKEDDAEVGNNNSISRGNINFMPGRIQKLVLLNDHDDLSDTVSSVDIESQDFEIGEEDQPNWRQMFISGLDDREKILLEEYTSVLRNYKDVRMKLNEVEKKNRDSIFELALQLRELKNALAKKDTEIHYLHQKLHSAYANPDESPYTVTTEYKYTPHEALLRNTAHGSNLQDPENSPSTLHSTAARSPFAEPRAKSVGDMDLSSMKPSLQDNLQILSSLEKKFRSDIDDLLEENIEFWLRFSTSVHQIQKFQNSIQDLKAELKRIKESKGKSEGYSSHSHSKHQSVQSQLRPIFRHLREIRTELSLWLEHNSVLQDELHGRYSSLCNILDEIARAGNAESAGEKAELSGYQAAKFQGEVLNMKQENSKVASELQAGLSLVKGMKNDVEKTLDELDQAIGLSSNNNFAITKQYSSNRPRIPLKSFLFGVKLKKQKQNKQSIFACVNPAMHKQYSDMRSGNNSAPI